MVALLSLILLAAELKQIKFDPGLRVGEKESQTVQASVANVIQQFVEVPAWKKAVFFVTIFLIVVLVSSVLSPELRKRVIRQFLQMMAFTAAIYLIFKNNPDLLLKFRLNPGQFGGPSPDAAAEGFTTPVFEPPHISNFLSYLIAFIVILVLAGLAWLFNRWWKRQSILTSKTLDDIASAARDSLQELSSGEQSGDTIIRCYARMSRVVGAKRGLHRGMGMTASEFAERLEEAGLPRDPVHRLTRLFEAVRYNSGRRLTQKDIIEATECLTTVLRYCGEAA